MGISTLGRQLGTNIPGRPRRYGEHEAVNSFLYGVSALARRHGSEQVLRANWSTEDRHHTVNRGRRHLVIYFGLWYLPAKAAGDITDTSDSDQFCRPPQTRTAFRPSHATGASRMSETDSSVNRSARRAQSPNSDPKHAVPRVCQRRSNKPRRGDQRTNVQTVRRGCAARRACRSRTSN